MNYTIIHLIDVKEDLCGLPTSYHMHLTIGPFLINLLYLRLLIIVLGEHIIITDIWTRLIILTKNNDSNRFVII